MMHQSFGLCATPSHIAAALQVRYSDYSDA